MQNQSPVLGRFDRPTASPRTRIAVLADLHLSPEETGTWRVSHRTEERLEATVRSLNRAALDAVLFVGDLVQGGLRSEYEAFDAAIADLDAPLYAVPGNHDLIGWGSRPSLPLSEFERRYTPGRLPYHERIGGVDVLALNSNPSTRETLADTFDGRVSATSLSWFDEKLSAVESPLVVVHHALEPARAQYRRGLRELPESGDSPPFRNGEELLTVLSERAAPLVVTGHLHVPLVAHAAGIREFTLPPLGPFPAGYTILDVGERGTTATFHSVTDFEGRLEALAHGLEHDRVLLTAAQLAGLPLVDDHVGGSRAPGDGN